MSPMHRNLGALSMALSMALLWMGGWAPSGLAETPHESVKQGPASLPIPVIQADAQPGVTPLQAIPPTSPEFSLPYVLELETLRPLGGWLLNRLLQKVLEDPENQDLIADLLLTRMRGEMQSQLSTLGQGLIGPAIAQEFAGQTGLRGLFGRLMTQRMLGALDLSRLQALLKPIAPSRLAAPAVKLKAGRFQLDSRDTPPQTVAVPRGKYEVTIVPPKLADQVLLFLDGRQVVDAKQCGKSFALECLPPGRHLLQARYRYAKHWSEISVPLWFEVRAPETPRIVAVSGTDCAVEPLSRRPIPIRGQALQLRLANVRHHDDIVAYIDGIELAHAKVQACGVCLTLPWNGPPGRYTLTVRHRDADGLASNESNAVALQYYDPDLYIFGPSEPDRRCEPSGSCPGHGQAVDESDSSELRRYKATSRSSSPRTADVVLCAYGLEAEGGSEPRTRAGNKASVAPSSRRVNDDLQRLADELRTKLDDALPDMTSYVSVTADAAARCRELVENNVSRCDLAHRRDQTARDVFERAMQSWRGIKPPSTSTVDVPNYLKSLNAAQERHANRAKTVRDQQVEVDKQTLEAARLRAAAIATARAEGQTANAGLIEAQAKAAEKQRDAAIAELAERQRALSAAEEELDEAREAHRDAGAQATHLRELLEAWQITFDQLNRDAAPAIATLSRATCDSAAAARLATALENAVKNVTEAEVRVRQAVEEFRSRIAEIRRITAVLPGDKDRRRQAIHRARDLHCEALNYAAQAEDAMKEVKNRFAQAQQAAAALSAAELAAIRAEPAAHEAVTKLDALAAQAKRLAVAIDLAALARATRFVETERAKLAVTASGANLETQRQTKDLDRQVAELRSEFDTTELEAQAAVAERDAERALRRSRAVLKIEREKNADPDARAKEELPAAPLATKTFHFASAAHFPWLEPGRAGTTFESEGLIVFEDMQLTFDECGEYTVCLRVAPPATETRLRLQLEVQVQGTNAWYTITLPERRLDGHANASYGYGGDLGDPQGKSGQIEVQFQGRAEVLHRHFHDICRIKRNGVARFGVRTLSSL